MKYIKWTVIGILVLVVCGLAFLRFAPGYEMYFVRSESMTPNINLGDVVVVGPVSIGISPGSIITFELSDKQRVTHRVVEVKGNQLTTKGDAMQHNDPFSVSLSQVKGIYLFKIPLIGYLTSFIRTKLGWWLTIIVPAAALVIWIIKDIIKEALSNGSDYY